MSLLSKLLAVACGIGFFAAIFFVVFGQITVRKLRKIPELKNELGVEFVSGWDIVNVAQSLSLPSNIIKKLENGPLSSFYASSELLYRHTSRFDRILAVLFYWLLMVSGLMMVLLMLLDTIGVFD